MGTLLSDRELDVMSVLWERGSGTVAEVRAALNAGLAYTTVLTVLRVLESKGHVRHEGEGRAHRYFAVIREGAARRGAVRQLLQRFFEGSPELLVTELMSDRRLSGEEIRRLRRLLDARARGAKP